MKKILSIITALTCVMPGVAFASDTNSEELLMVLEVSRHGAREASKLYPLTRHPWENFNSTE
jgi:hypothetical protein